MFSHRKIVPSPSIFHDILITAALAAGLLALYAATISSAGKLPVLALCLGAAAVLGGGWLLKRAILEKARLPRAGFELWLVLFLLGALLSVLFSGYPRIGLEKVGWYLCLAVLFYALLDLAEQPRLRLRIQQVWLFFTGVTLLLALLETYTQYLIWWELAGSRSISPPHPYRFVSVVVQSNVFMGLVNMLAPLALAAFFTTRRRAGRVFSALWIVLYAGAAAFSSSRGGWLGAAAWVGVFGLLWLLDAQRWLRLARWLRRRWAVGLAAGLAGLAAGGYAAFKVYTIFAAANPSHGGGSNINREWIWEIALRVWRESPWTGTGLGKLGLDFQRITQGYPVPWWPKHAHSLPLEILAETGLAGFLPFLALTAAAAAVLVRCYRRTPAAQRVNSAAALAGLAGLFVHGIFEDFSSHPLLVAVVLALIASVIAAAGPLPRFKRVSLGWLMAPGLALAALAAFTLWSYAPLYTAASASPEANWQQAAETAEQSALRDPGMAYYHFQAAIAWSMAWQQTGDHRALEQARARMQKGLQIDPSSSIYWADLAVLDWHAGQREAALDRIRQAAAMSPQEASYPLTWGWFLEQAGRDEAAVRQYTSALHIVPRAAGHPFWQMTPLRQQAAAGIPAPVDAASTYWNQARQQLSGGDFAAARLSLAKSYFFREQPTAFAVSSAEFYARTGQPAKARLYLQGLVGALDQSYWNFTIGEFSYRGYMARVDFSHSLVPGFLRITPDVGQFQALETLYRQQAADGGCAAAARTWAVLQREIHAGEWPSGGYAPAGQCP